MSTHYIHSQMTTYHRSNDYTIDYIHSQMTTKLTIYIVIMPNDYTIDYIHSQMTIYSLMTTQLIHT